MFICFLLLRHRKFEYRTRLWILDVNIDRNVWISDLNVHYIGDLNNGNIWIMNFYMFAIQMPVKSPVFRWHLNSRTCCPGFRSQVMFKIQAMILIVDNFVRYSKHHLNGDPNTIYLLGADRIGILVDRQAGPCMGAWWWWCWWGCFKWCVILPAWTWSLGESWFGDTCPCRQ